MNELEKRSFYSFLGLYLVSSFLFILLAAFWYYTSQKFSIETNEHYRLEHIADRIGTAVIMAHMHGTPLQLPHIPTDTAVALIGMDGNLHSGSMPVKVIPSDPLYSEESGYMVLVSDAPKEHLGIRYVVVESDALFGMLAQLRQVVFFMSLAILVLVFAVAWTLSKLFMRPIHQRFVQTERFVNDITHELNTPITALSLTSEQAMKQGGCTPKMLRNLSASTRQLYDIYRALTYLNFHRKSEPPAPIDLAAALQKIADYYRPLCETKRIDLVVKAEAFLFAITDAEAQLLFGNLIGNAIKYSPPHSRVSVMLKEGCLEVKDKGIGIAPEQQERIFDAFTRATEQGGGFGVGLSVVKRICDNYGITVTLESAEGKGTLFRLSFSSPSV